MREVIYRGAAGVHLDKSGIVGDEFLPLAGGGIVQDHKKYSFMNITGLRKDIQNQSADFDFEKEEGGSRA
jgi:hypothetical protein